MIVWEVGQWGHVALVTAVGRDFVDVIEQNVSNSNGKARLPYANGRIGARWGSWVPAGWAHAKANTSGGGNTGGGGNNVNGGACAKVSAVGGVIDDDNACFVPSGNPAWLRAESGHGFGGDLIWTHTTNKDSADNAVTWRLDLARAGRYRVEAFVAGAVAESEQARYRVRHNGTVDTVTLDQSAGGGWRTLGDFRFAAGDGQRVYLGDSLFVQPPSLPNE
jgi:hypothetical protein